MNDFHFELEMEVRDYECDIQGIVNNAVYQNYLEHCRHQFLHKAGIDFAGLHNDGIDAVVIRAEIDYKLPLMPGDAFFVRLKMARQGKLRILFIQQILRKSDLKLIVDASIFAVLTQKGRPVASDLLIGKFENAGIKVEEIKKP